MAAPTALPARRRAGGPRRSRPLPSPSRLRRILAAAGCIVVPLGLASCTEAPPADPTGGLAVVVGARANMPPVALDGIAAQVVANAADTQADVAVLVADGTPAVVGTQRVRTAGADGDARRADRARDRRALEEDLRAAAADSPETDLLTALGMAAQAVAEAPGRHTVLVVDSGLSTAGALDFRQPGLLDADAADLVESLRAAGALPDLTGVHVVFQGLGDTAAPQPALDAVTRAQLVELWTAVALASGAVDVNVEHTPLAGTPDPALPPVSTVGAGGGVTCTSDTVVLDGGAVSFLADSAAFRDLVAATETLQPIADRMREAGATATLTGTTADVGDAEGQVRLSRERAQAVADLLAQLGVPAASMGVVGLGSDFPGYVPDHDEQGRLIPGAAALNRKVVIELSGATVTVCS
ncbi:OmpA family protein [Geodermatophilus sp. SYSU D00758]